MFLNKSKSVPSDASAAQTADVPPSARKSRGITFSADDKDSSAPVSKTVSGESSARSGTITGPAPGRVSERVSFKKRESTQSNDDGNWPSMVATGSKLKHAATLSLVHSGDPSAGCSIQASISEESHGSDGPSKKSSATSSTAEAGNSSCGQDLKARLFDISTDEEANYKRLGVQRSWPFSLVTDIWPELLKHMEVFKVDNSFHTYNSYRSLMPDDRVRYSYFNIYEETGHDPDVFVIRAFSTFNHFVQLLLLVLAAWSIIFSAYAATFAEAGYPQEYFLMLAILDAALEALYLFGFLARMRTTVIDHRWGKEYCNLDVIQSKNLYDHRFWFDLVSLVPLVLSDFSGAPRWILFVTKLSRGWRLLVPPPQAKVIFSAKLELFRMTLLICVGGHLVGCLWRLLRSDAPMWDQDRQYSQSLSVGMNLILGMEQFKASESAFEDWFLAFSVPVGATVQAVVIGTVLTILQRLTALQNEEIRWQDVNRQAMQTLRLPPSVQLRVFALASYQRLQRNNIALRTLSQNLSSQLQWELNLCLYHEILSQANLFKQLPPGMMLDVVMSFEDNVYLPGDFVCRYGETGDGMHFILKGLCAVFNATMKILFGYKGQGDYFGEVSLITEARRSAYVRAETFCTVAFFSKSSFDAILSVHPEQLEVMIHFMDADQKEQLRLNLGSRGLGGRTSSQSSIGSDAEGTDTKDGDASDEDDKSKGSDCDSDNSDDDKDSDQGSTKDTQKIEVLPPGMISMSNGANDVIEEAEEELRKSQEEFGTASGSASHTPSPPPPPQLVEHPPPPPPKMTSQEDQRISSSPPPVRTVSARSSASVAGKKDGANSGNATGPSSPKSPGRRSLFNSVFSSNPSPSANGPNHSLRRSSTEQALDGGAAAKAAAEQKRGKQDTFARRKSEGWKMAFGKRPSVKKDNDGPASPNASGWRKSWDQTGIDWSNAEEPEQTEQEAEKNAISMRRLTATLGSLGASRASGQGTADAFSEVRLRGALANLLQPLRVQIDRLQAFTSENEAEHIKEMKLQGKSLDELSGDIMKLRADVARLPQDERRGSARPQELLKHATAALEDSVTLNISASRTASPMPSMSFNAGNYEGGSRKPSLLPPEIAFGHASSQPLL
eukprot:gnl/MRDRNA2_/MRDRNA2_99997_c0_seq1.p1 gnl/MRDRNA2_/MRDRNA2_99997_c0~~gnl/MRDRNA2_/MRDRNA2_99997_c0_seq1.p1  ORF type:complete len:1121 (+),score=219.66 gnl/MRDRNA2_/MRDRNA2_99997_c0_seq1:122-3484(+)